MVNFIKPSVIWLFKNKSVTFKYIKLGLEAAKLVSKATKSRKDDSGVLYVERQINKAIEFLPDGDKDYVVRKINDAKGALKDLNVAINDKKVKANIS